MDSNWRKHNGKLMVELHRSTYRVCRSLKTFRKVSHTELRSFALAISLIALGLRTGFLFDSFAVPGERLRTFCELLELLRKDVSQFNEVVILHIEQTDDFFFVHAALLLQRCESELNYLFSAEGSSGQSGSPSVCFVSVSSAHISVMSSPPIHLPQTLREIQDSMHLPDKDGIRPLFVQIASSDASAADIIPLAAVLLEYPVAYVPEDSQQTTFLSGVELEVYSCSIAFDPPQEDLPPRHVFMQFSCPRMLTVVTAGMKEDLQTKFADRIAKAELWCTLEISSRTERLERVAL